VRTLKFEGTVELEVDFHHEVMAEPGLLVPGVRRLGPTTLGYRAQDYLIAFEMVRLLALLAGTF
jgi:D-amino peptidase